MGCFKKIAFIFLLLTVVSTSAFGLEISLKKEADVAGVTTTLGDVAMVRPASSEARVLSARTLFRSPEPGHRNTYTAAEVRSALEQADPELPRCRWAGADQVVVKRSGIAIGPKAIRHILKNFIRRKQAFLPQAQIRFDHLYYPMPFMLPQGKLQVEVIPSDPRILHSHRFTLIFRVDGQVEKNIAVGGELKAIAPVVVAAGDLRRGAILTSHDVNLAKLDLTRLRNPCFNLKDVVGKKLLRSVRLGQPLQHRDVVDPPVVHRGQLVTMVARKGALTITAMGIARQDGAAGAMIHVLNSSSRKEILCKVSAPGKVEVEF